MPLRHRADKVRSWARHRLALLVDPRPDSSSGRGIAAEIRALADHVDLAVHAIPIALRDDRRPHPAIEAALEERGIPLLWHAPVVRADTIIFHDPGALRFESRFPTRLSATLAFVVTHENFLRANGSEAFDVASCLALLERALVVGQRQLVPVSRPNRGAVETWLAQQAASEWRLAPRDWIGTLDAPVASPTTTPRDRRGRFSPPGLEWFPPLQALQAHFPAHAEACIIVGGDHLLVALPSMPRNWDVRRFTATDVDAFLREIDFLVHFTHPLWREGFSYTIAAAIAAGKVVITDRATAEPFGPAVIVAETTEVDGIVQRFVADPERYATFVVRAQARLRNLRPNTFVARLLAHIEQARAAPNALV